MPDPLIKESEVHAAIDAGLAGAKAADRVIDVRGIPVAIVPDSMSYALLTEAMDEAERRGAAPTRRKGTSFHHEVESFIAHVNRFKDGDSAIFAKSEDTKLIAVLDYHRAGPTASPRWGEHRSIYACPKSRQWLLWVAASEKTYSQESFGEFIDANMSDLANPEPGAISTDVASPAAVLQMARNLVIHTKGEFSRVINPTTGEGSLVSKLENEQSSTKIPRAFYVGIPVFEGGVLYRIEARIRFSMQSGRPSFGFLLYQHETVLRDAFGEVRKLVAEGTGLPVFAGSPE